jgi:hypothetical protein
MQIFEKNLVNTSGDELRSKLIQLEQACRSIRAVLAIRQDDGNKFRYGYMTNSGWTGFDYLSEAIDAIVKETGDPDAGYRVDKVYL